MHDINKVKSFLAAFYGNMWKKLETLGHLSQALSSHQWNAKDDLKLHRHTSACSLQQNSNSDTNGEIFTFFFSN
jgi:hypothetical protein